MSLKNKLSICLLSLSSVAIAEGPIKDELSYALGMTLSKQVVQLANFDDINTFYEGFEDSFLQQPLALTQQQIDYAAGLTYADYIKDQGLQVESPDFLKGFEKALKGQELKMSEEEAQSIITAYFETLQKEKEEKMNTIALDNEKEGLEYLERNAQSDSVVRLDSGLQYKVIDKSTLQNHPEVTDTVVVHYEGRLIDGTIFDSSYKRGEPAQFQLQQVIAGWTEILQLMAPGDKWEVSIPHDLAYSTYAPASIGPNKTLIFDIELLEIIK